MNSVGHMTRSRLEGSLAQFPNLQSGLPTDRLVDFALYFAMKTIRKASLGARPGTHLLARDASCKLAGDLRNAALRDMTNFNERTYCGQYHTDVTVPGPYFDPAVEKPAASAEHDLLFTYLHDHEDTDYGLMGLGEAVAAEVFKALGWTTEV
jgi:hypothetical protein